MISLKSEWKWVADKLKDSIGFPMKPDFAATEFAELRALPVIRNSHRFTNATVVQDTDRLALIVDVREDSSTLAGREEPSPSSSIDRTVMVFAVADDALPALEMESLSPLKWWVSNFLLPIVGVKQVKLIVSPDASEVEELRAFAKNYGMKLDESSWVGNSQDCEQLMPGVLEAVRRMFHVESVRFFAATPGWNVQSAGGWLAVWREERVLSADERPAFLAEAKSLRDLLTRSSAAPIPALLAVAFPRRADFCRIIAVFFGAAAGFVFTLLLQLGYWVFMNPRFWPSLWWTIPGVLLGAFLGKRFLAPTFVAADSRARGIRE